MDGSLPHCTNDLYATYAAIGSVIAANASVHDASRQLDMQGWELVTNEGLWKIAVPLNRGGLGGTWSEFAVALEGLASTCTDLGFLISSLGQIGAVRLLLDAGTEEQIDRWLPPLLQGKISIIAMTEPSGGSDLSRITLQAKSNTNGWSLSGRKSHITNAPVASFGMVAGRIPELGAKKDITLFFIDFPMDGVVRGNTEDTLGIRSSPTGDVIFDNAPIQPINIIGEAGDGLRILQKLIAFERSLYGIIGAGLIDGMIALAMVRSSERRAFGKPISDFQYVQGRITDMAMAAITCRLTGREAIKTIDSVTHDTSIMASAAKFYAGEYVLTSAEHLVQIHGHLGYTNGPITRLLRDAVGMRIAGGTSDIQKINIFNQLKRKFSH